MLVNKVLLINYFIFLLYIYFIKIWYNLCEFFEFDIFWIVFYVCYLWFVLIKYVYMYVNEYYMKV